MLQGSAGAIPADEMRTAAKARKVRLGRPPLGRPMFPPSPVTCWTIRGSRRRGLERERRANAGRTAATSPRAACRARAPAFRRSPLGRTPAPPPQTPPPVERDAEPSSPSALRTGALDSAVSHLPLLNASLTSIPTAPSPPPRPPTPRRTGRRSVSRLWSARRSFARSARLRSARRSCPPPSPCAD